MTGVGNALIDVRAREEAEPRAAPTRRERHSTPEASAGLTARPNALADAGDQRQHVARALSSTPSSAR